jgi:hypothetical protein
MIESFLYGAWIGGQVLYRFFLKHQTQALGARYWEDFQLRRNLSRSNTANSCQAVASQRSMHGS